MHVAFRGERFFLSNMYPCTIVHDGVPWVSSEHAFVAASTDSPQEKALVQMALDGKEAKRLGKTFTKRPNWERDKVYVMLDIVRQKFVQNHDLAAKLLATSDEPLIEYNVWRDRYWGVYEGEGENWLGKVLMRVRDELDRGPGKRFVVTGSRFYGELTRDTKPPEIAAAEIEEVYRHLDRAYRRELFQVLIVGRCPSGVDKLAEQWARNLVIPIEPYPANWEKYKGAAGPIRNAEMVVRGRPDYGIVFPGGKGTRDMRQKLLDAQIPIWEPVKTLLWPHYAVFPGE